MGQLCAGQLSDHQDLGLDGPAWPHPVLSDRPTELLTSRPRLSTRAAFLPGMLGGHNLEIL